MFKALDSDATELPSLFFTYSASLCHNLICVNSWYFLWELHYSELEWSIFWLYVSNVFLFVPWWYGLSSTPSRLYVVWEEFTRKYTTPTPFLLKVSVRFPWIKEKPSSCIAMPGALRLSHVSEKKKAQYFLKLDDVVPQLDVDSENTWSVLVFQLILACWLFLLTHLFVSWLHFTGILCAPGWQWRSSSQLTSYQMTSYIGWFCSHA